MHNKILSFIILSSLIIAACTLTRGHLWGDDFASYIMQAESILSGTTQEFVEHNSFTMFESSFPIGPVAYPWGYPLILTPIYAIKGNHPLALKLPGLLFYAGFLSCLYLLMKNRLTHTENLLLISLFAFNPSLLVFLDSIFSDVPFSFFIILALLYMMKSKASRGNNVILGVVLFLAFFLRTSGIILVASILLYQSIRFFRENESRRIILIRSIQSMVAFGTLWLITSFIFPDEQGSYLGQLSGLTPAVIKASISYYFYCFGTFFGDGRTWEILYYIVVIFFFIGVWARYAFDQIFIIFFTLYIGALLLWPYWQGIRFILPLLPLFIYFAFQGMKFALGKLPTKYVQTGQWVFYGFWSLIITVFLFSSSATAYANLQNDRAINGPYHPYSQEVYKYIRKETPVDSIVVFFQPRLMRLMTNRDSIMSVECNRLLKGDYLVLRRKAEEDELQIQPEDLPTCNLPLNRVFKNRRFFVYKIQK
ncbi:MAG: hypothetical protein EHM33_07585 [Chloroflexi bacterium]|nr:MAG: hypothetical protein EHM33_07585 [Chloroflexota bacterium]